MKKTIFYISLLLIGFILGAWYFSGGIIPEKPENAGPPAVFASSINDNKPSSFSNAAEKVTPGVVKIISYVEQQTRYNFGDDFGFFDDDFWKRFFGVPRNRIVKGMGSGFLVSENGYIVTNNHVVENAKKITVYTHSGEKYNAKIKGTDPKTDIALIKIEADNLPFLEFGDSSELKVGQWVMAVGNPLGTSYTVTAGIVSAKGRQLGTDMYTDYIQTDAAINRGNSGGPLVNLQGQVVGVNSTIITPNQGFVGIGFAVPSNIVKTIIKDLRTKGKVTRGWIGIYIEDITPEEKDALGLDSTKGAIVSKVVEDSPADKAGLKPYDVIIKADNKKIKNGAELKLKIGSTPPGETVVFDIIRDKNQIQKKVKIGKLGDDESTEETNKKTLGSEKQLGLKLVPLTERTARNYGIPEAGGLLVLNVEPYSPADEADFNRGDIIVEVNRIKVNNLEQFRQIINRAQEQGKRALLFKVRYYTRSGEVYETIKAIRLN